MFKEGGSLVDVDLLVSNIAVRYYGIGASTSIGVKLLNTEA